MPNVHPRPSRGPNHPHPTLAQLSSEGCAKYGPHGASVQTSWSVRTHIPARDRAHKLRIGPLGHQQAAATTAASGSGTPDAFPTKTAGVVQTERGPPSVSYTNAPLLKPYPRPSGTTRLIWIGAGSRACPQTSSLTGSRADSGSIRCSSNSCRPSSPTEMNSLHVAAGAAVQALCPRGHGLAGRRRGPPSLRMMTMVALDGNKT